MCPNVLFKPQGAVCVTTYLDQQHVDCVVQRVLRLQYVLVLVVHCCSVRPITPSHLRWFIWVKSSIGKTLSLSLSLSLLDFVFRCSDRFRGRERFTYSKTNIPHDRTNMFKFFALPVFTSRSHVSCKASHRPLIKKQTNNYKNRPIFGKNHNFSASDPKACFTCEQCVCVCVRASKRAHARAVIVSRSSRKWNLKTSCYGRS